MRTTVGPLPAAVYWRRRAVVLSALVLGALILFMSCSGGDDPKRPPDAGPTAPGSNGNAGTQGQPTAEPQQTFTSKGPGGGGPQLAPPPDAPTGEAGEAPADGVTAAPGAGNPAPGAGNPAPGAGNPGASAGTPGAADANNLQVAAGELCTDAEMSVTPIPAATEAKRGAPLEIRLRIKNVSTRTCARDVGADLQEIYLKQGARKVWSSDTCSTAKGSEVKRFTSGLEEVFGVTWNGRQSTRCQAGLAVGDAPAAGEYEVLGRLGGKISEPVRLTLTS